MLRMEQTFFAVHYLPMAEVLECCSSYQYQAGNENSITLWTVIYWFGSTEAPSM
jgi:hypothetical protein